MLFRSQEDVLRLELGQRDVGRVAVVAVEDQEFDLGSGHHHAQQVPGADPFPLAVVERPGGDAVDVGGQLALGLRHEVGPAPVDRIADLERISKRQVINDLNQICQCYYITSDYSYYYQPHRHIKFFPAFLWTISSQQVDQYFPEASSINFSRSMKYGLGVLGTSFTHFFNRIGLMKSEIYKTKK